MPTERCWCCRELKPDAWLARSDDRLCRDCYLENEQQLKEVHKHANETTLLPEAGANGSNEGATAKCDPGVITTRHGKNYHQAVDTRGSGSRGY
jgi:hypothetical protein